VVAVTQSGEIVDALSALRQQRQTGARTLAVTISNLRGLPGAVQQVLDNEE
jgi:glucosamine 6-phosphate synthetase-like amidotransferase/phosphosugar isomerase protein